MEIKLINSETGTQVSAVELNDTVFACKSNEPLVHQVVTAYLAAGRSGNKAQKTRSEVRGGGAKPWRQKGTGRARAGTSRSPIWRKGGVTFAAKPRDFTQKVNKKMYRGALKVIFSDLLREERLVVVENFSVSSPKTKELITKLQSLQLTEALVITDEVDNSLYLAARNLYKIMVTDLGGIDPVSLLKFKKIVLTLPVLKKLEGMLG